MPIVPKKFKNLDLSDLPTSNPGGGKPWLNNGALWVGDAVVITPTITSQPIDASVEEGSTATFSIVADNATGYQWQIQQSGAGAWSAISGATSATYTTGATSISADNGDKYRCIAVGTGSNSTSNEVTLTVSAVTDKILFVSFGESNSGGYAISAQAQSWELGSRSELQMWNVLNSNFESLDIGTNNNLDHAGLNSNTHGWELGLANRVKQGYFGAKTCYYLQTGQGASTIAQWAVGQTYWTKFLARTTAVKAAMTGTYQTVIWVSLGINDAIAVSPISAASYKSGMQEIIGRIKTQLPGCKIVLAKLPTSYDANGYSTKLDEIAAVDTDCVVVEVGNPELDMRDTNHWSYAGMKRLAARMTDATITKLGLASSKGLTWNAREDANYVYTTAVDQHAHVTSTVDVTVDGFIAFEAGYSGSSEGLVIALDAAANEVNWGGSDPYYGAAYSFGSQLQRASTNGSANNTSVSTPCWVRLRWYAANDNLTLETSADGGSTWTTQHTFTNALAGQTVAYVKALSAVGAAYMDVWKN